MDATKSGRMVLKEAKPSAAPNRLPSQRLAGDVVLQILSNVLFKRGEHAMDFTLWVE